MNVTKNATTAFAAIVVLVSLIAISSNYYLPVFADPSLPQHIGAGPPALPSFSAAYTVLDDSFDRPDSNEVGEGWVESERVGNSTVSIANNQLFFDDTSDGTNVPLVKRGFSAVSTGTLEWNFDFNWARTGNEKEYRFLMQLGDSAAMSDASQDDGVGVNLIWTIINNAHETLGSRAGGFNTALAVVSGPVHITVVADLGTNTYSVSVDDLEVGTGIPFDTDGPMDTVRFFTYHLHEQNISGRTIDELSIFSSDATPPVDAPPVAQDQSTSIGMDTPRLVTIIATDPVECQLTFSIVNGPINGSLGVLADQPCVAGGSNSDSATLIYTPNAGFDGPDSFTWRANDGLDDSNEAIVSINIFQTTNLLIDTFDRPDSSEVGSGWVEVEPAGASAEIADNKLQFADTSDVANRPLVKINFPQVSDGALLWDFDFDWARTGPERNYRFLMQLGDSATMSDDSQNAGVGVNLIWTENATVEQSLVYSKANANTHLAVLSGPNHISVVADLGTNTYSVAVNGSEVGTGIPFEANVPLDTVRLFTDIVNEPNFSGRTIDNLSVFSTSTVNAPPVADAGPDQVGVQVGATVNLDGNGSSDDDGDPLTFLWSLTTVPAASTTSLTGSTTSNPSFVPDLAGIYEVELVVNDGTDDSAPDTVTITAGSGTSTLLSDDFDRPDNPIVEGWVEVQAAGATVSIASNKLFFDDTSNALQRPSVSRSFTPVSAGTLQWEFDFDWTKNALDSDSQVWMQLGDSTQMVNSNRFTGVGVDMQWTNFAGVDQNLVARENGSGTGLLTAPMFGLKHLAVTADVAAKTYSVSIDGTEVGSGLSFDNLSTVSTLDTVRFFTNNLDEVNFSGRTIDNVTVSLE